MHIILPNQWKGGQNYNFRCSTKTLLGEMNYVSEEINGSLTFSFKDGYGLLNVPTVPGTHQVECLTWRPAGSFSDRIWCIVISALISS